MIGKVRAGIVFATAALATPTPAPAQSLLDRPPNISGDWVSNTGTVQFNFLHRFVRSAPPARKVSNYPTFLMGLGLPSHFMLGFQYATNSTLAPRYPNEWEFFVRWHPFNESEEAPLDLGAQLAYNLAAEGVDGELSLAKRVGPVRLVGVGRVLADPYQSGSTRFAIGGGGTLRLRRWLAIAGDYTTILNRDTARGERAAWSVGLHLAIPNTPHSLSIQMTNTNTSTMQGSSRGDAQRRYGFEFTIPITLARYFGRTGNTAVVADDSVAASPAPTAPPSAEPEPIAGAPSKTTDTTASPAPPVPGVRPPASEAARTSPPAAVAPATPKPAARTVRTQMVNMAYARRSIEITVGTTIIWRNDDPLAHTVTATNRRFDSGLVAPGSTWKYTFSQPGSYSFTCTPHPFMKGTVIVRPAP